MIWHSKIEFFLNFIFFLQFRVNSNCSSPFQLLCCISLHSSAHSHVCAIRLLYWFSFSFLRFEWNYTLLTIVSILKTKSTLTLIAAAAAASCSHTKQFSNYNFWRHFNLYQLKAYCQIITVCCQFNVSFHIVIVSLSLSTWNLYKFLVLMCIIIGVE